MKAYVYKITNRINGKSYIGQTVQALRKRWSEHCRNTSCCPALKNAIAKYGKENFEFSVLCELEFSDKREVKARLDELEKSLISSENTIVPNGYNVLSGGNGSVGRRWKSPPFLGKKWSEEHRLKFMSTRALRKYGPRTDAHKKKAAEGHYKPVRCLETKDTWPSVQACAAHFGVKPKQVSRVLTGKRKRLKRKFTLVYDRQS